MFGYYTPILLLQAFCLYHAYRNGAEYRWYFFILIFPGIGCGFYLFHHFYNRRSINTIAESVKGVINTSYKLEQLQKAHRFSDNLTNRLNLAEGYIEYGRFEEAIALYKESLTGFMADDAALQMKLLRAYFLNNNFQEVIRMGEQLSGDKTFQSAEARLSYAWALHYSGRTDEAEQIFISTNKSYTNYAHRKEYCRFLLETGRTDEMRVIVSEILEEVENMRGPEKRFYRELAREIKEMGNVVPG